MRSFFFFFIMLSVFSSCSESSSSDSVFLTVEPSSLTFSSDGGTANLTISSNSGWSITTSSEDIKVTPFSGSGNKTVQVNVPQRKIIEQRNDKLVIKSSDGSVIHNIEVIQEGFLTSGEELRVTNQGSYMAIGGKAQSLDSLRIISSAPWELRGPEWIEAYNGSRWIALSPSRAVISGNATLAGTNDDIKTLYIRTAYNNQSTDNMVGRLILSQQYSGKLKNEIQISQLGRYHVAPNRFVALADGMATNWKCGYDVESFYWTVTTKELTKVDPTKDNNSEWIAMTSEEGWTSWWTGLEEKTKYNINICIQSPDKHWFYDSYSFQTGSSENQAVAFIENVFHDGEMWRWQIRPNERCKLYALVAFSNPDLFYVPDAYLAWLIAVGGFRTYRLQDGNIYDSYSWKNSDPIQLVTWGVGSSGTNMADVISRYRTIDYSNARSQCKDAISTRVGATRIDSELLKKSLHYFIIHDDK